MFEYMNVALTEANKAFRRNEVPIGAVIVFNNKIIAKAFNNRNRKIDVTNHAEIIAIRKAARKLGDWRLSECDLYVTYSDEYSNSEYYISPSLMNSKELENLVKLEHKLSKDDILKFSNTWEELVRSNSEMRILENGIVKSVSINYYDSMILDKLKLLGSVKVSKLVAMLIQEIYLTDILYVYLIMKLIKNGKIKVVKIDNNRFFDNVIELV